MQESESVRGQTGRLVTDLAKFPDENPNPVLRVKGDGLVVYTNDAAAAISGLYTGGGNFLVGEVREHVAAAAKLGSSVDVEFTEGERLFALAVTPVPGKPYLNIYGRDVTEERKAQRETRDLAKFPEENPNPVLRVDQGGRILFANGAARALAGLLQERDTMLAADLVKPVAAAFAASESRTVEWSCGDCLFSLFLTPVPGTGYANVYGRDITEERRAAAEVLRVKNFNQRILDNLTNGIVTFDGSLCVTSANPSAERLLGLAATDMAGRSVWELFGGDNAWLAGILAGTDFTAGGCNWLDREIVRGSGDRISVNLNVVSLDEDNASTGLMLVIEDITGEKRLKGTMVRFMSDSVVERLLHAEEELLGGATQEATILFSDLRDFTSISEKLGAREMVRVLNSYFSEMVDVIFDHQGTLDKFIGDAIMAVFGAPFVSPQDPDNAVSAAVEMLRRLRRFNQAQRDLGRPTLNMGVGINTGTVIAGTIGSARRMDYTVIGEHVNLASRIEAVNKQYGTEILISDYTNGRLKTRGAVREVDLVRVKGVARPVPLFEILDHHTPETFPNLDRVLERFGEGLQHYRKRAFRKGASAFADALAANPNDRPTQILLSRCWTYMVDPPDESWEGEARVDKA